MKNLQGAQGLKTGYTSKAGWNIIISARRGDHTLIGVIMGGSCYKVRDLRMINLMNKEFAKLKLNKQKSKTRHSIYRVKNLFIDQNLKSSLLGKPYECYLSCKQGKLLISFLKN